MVMIDAPAPSGSIVTVTTVWMVGSGREVYQPELAAGPVVFTDYLQVASNQGR